ncbi:MAG: superoxide dismutase family protein [Acidimicrobiales bacterium]
MQRALWRRSIFGALAIATIGLASVATAPASAARKPLVRAALHDTAGAEVGEVVFKGRAGVITRVEVELDAPGAPNPGDFHGFHIHATGSCDPAASGSANVPFGSAGGHWNPGAGAHGSHAGDMPSVLLDTAGGGYAEFETDRFSVASLFDADGSAVILHVGRDNFANIPSTYSSGGLPGPNAATLATGDAGGRYACGVVAPA